MQDEDNNGAGKKITNSAFFQILVRILLGIILFIVLLISIFTAIAKMDIQASADEFLGGGSYIVKTDDAGAMQPLTKAQLKKAIDSCYSGQTQSNFNSVIDTFISIQNTYHVNGAYAMAVTVIESSGGTAWDLISPSTYNWYSIKGSRNGGYVDRNGTSWNVYSSFGEAVEEFAKLMVEVYFPSDKISVDTIAPTYCDANWGERVKAELDKIYGAAGVEINISGGSVEGQKIVNKAAEIMKYMMDNNYVYGQGNRVPRSNNGKQCDCSTFVCWVLYELGITNCQNNGSQLTTFDMDTGGKGYFANNGWKRINSYNDLQPGDIVIMYGDGTANGHVQIFAYKKDGTNYFINCGWNPCDHTSVYETYHTEFYSAWRCN